ncbi:MAG TPA: hypothetical protein VG944_01560 [Fimbriimonas sp.]|nr:hypothetical protein [Fimbriimonas sp.]
MSLVRGTLQLSLVALILVMAGGGLAYGWQGMVAGALGVLVTDLDLVSLGLFSNVLLNQQPGLRVTQLCISFLVLKLPILTGTLLLAIRLGSGPTGCFLIGIALVYCAMVHVAIRGAGTRQRDQFS